MDISFQDQPARGKPYTVRDFVTNEQARYPGNNAGEQRALVHGYELWCCGHEYEVRQGPLIVDYRCPERVQWPGSAS